MVDFAVNNLLVLCCCRVNTIEYFFYDSLFSMHIDVERHVIKLHGTAQFVFVFVSYVVSYER